MSIPTHQSDLVPTSFNLHNLFLQNELRNDKKILTSRRLRAVGFTDERD